MVSTPPGWNTAIEADDELGIPVPEQEPQRVHLVSSSMTMFRACWVTPVPVGCTVTPAICSRRLSCSTKIRT
jgi:hypothetical protein